MAPNDDRGDDTCESDRIAPDARRTDSEHPDSDPPLEPITSNEELERFASFTEAVRDALGESGRIKELRPDEAAERGCLSTLRSLHRRGRAELTVNLCTSAAKGGQLEVLEWLRENAGGGGGNHLEVLQWARERPVGQELRRRARRRRIAATSTSLQWARENGCPWDENTCWAAAQGAPARGTAVTSGARERLPVGRRTRAAGGLSRARGGSGWRCSEACVGLCSGRARTAARGTRTPARASGREAQGRPRAEASAATGLQWARENGCPWDENTCSDAAQGGHLAALQLLRVGA